MSNICVSFSGDPWFNCSWRQISSRPTLPILESGASPDFTFKSVVLFEFIGLQHGVVESRRTVKFK